MSSIRWLPLESNPEVMNKFLENLGVPPKWKVTDIISLDEEFLHMIPIPSLAVLLLFPVSAKHDEHHAIQGGTPKPQEGVGNVYFMKQTIRNACGTVALIHAIGNCQQRLNLDPNSVLHKFLETTRDLTPEERGKLLEQDMDISTAHEASAQQGQTEAPNLDDDTNLHFIAIVNAQGKLYELDGRKDGPIFHGDTSEDAFIKDALRVCKEYMERDPGNLNFTALSFGAAA